MKMTKIEAIDVILKDSYKRCTKSSYAKLHRALMALRLSDQEIREVECRFEYRRTPDSDPDPEFTNK